MPIRTVPIGALNLPARSSLSESILRNGRNGNDEYEMAVTSRGVPLLIRWLLVILLHVYGVTTSELRGAHSFR